MATADLNPPNAPFTGSQTPVGASDASGSPNNSSPLLPATAKEGDGAGEPVGASSSGKRKLWWLWALPVLVVVVLVVILPVYFKVIKPRQNNAVAVVTSGNSSSGNDGGDKSGDEQPKTPTNPTTGGDGSTITAEDGSTFTYRNQFGGYWVSDPNDPFNDGAKPNSWTPALNETWTWGTDHVFGVNLGGLFVLEPFISPALFQKYPGAVDEWTLSEAMAADTAGGGLAQLEDHYKNFITEQDIAEIAGAGLNWIRLPVPFWAISKMEDEPFLEKVSWKYILRIFNWCRKYGLRVKLDLHTIPGSHNSFNHGGKQGALNFLAGSMGIANAQRAMDYMRIFTEFISQPEYANVVPMFGIMNEARLSYLSRDSLTSFYLEMHKNIRAITGFGEGKGPYIAIHDGFDGPSSWVDFLTGSDRIALDFHPYISFNEQPNVAPIDTGTGASAGGPYPERACRTWGSVMRNSQRGFGVTVAGEFSNGYNDCGLFLRGVPGSPSTPNCASFEDPRTFDASMKAGLRAFAEAQMDALGEWFFWTWKIGNSTAGIVEAPFWSYKLGLENGWMPTDPRKAAGKCERIGVTIDEFNGNYESWQTGGARAGTIAAASTSQYPWPPVSIARFNGDITDMPTYTPTGPIPTLPPPTFTPAATNSVDGWFNDQDTAGAYVPIQGCRYPDNWDAGPAIPSRCSAGRGTSEPTEAPAQRRQIRGRPL